MAARHQQYMDLVPKSEWKDQPEATLLNIDLPGFTKEQIKVTYVHTTKTIRVTGERPLADRRWTRFNEAFTVPQNSLVDKIQGGFKNNVLTITIPKETITKMANLPETSKTKAAPLEKVAKLEEKRLLEESIRKEKEEKEAEQKRKQLLEEKDELIRKLQEDAKAKEMAEERKLQEAAKAKEMKLQEEKEAEERKLQEAAKAKEMKLQEEKEAEQKRKQLLEEKDELIRKLQEDAKAKEMAEERKLQEAAKAKEMKLQEAAKEKEKAEERKLQEAAKEKEKAEERKLQEEVKAKEKAEERKLVEEARLAKIQEKKSVDESRGKEKILKPEVVYRKSGPVSGHKSGTGGVGEVVKSAEEKLGNLVEKEKKMGKGIMEKIRRKEITREEKKMMMNVGVAALVIFALGAYVSYTFCSPSSSCSSPSSSSSSTKPE